MVLLMQCDQSYIEQVIVFLESFFEFHKDVSVTLFIADRNWEEKNKGIVFEYLRAHDSKCRFIDIRKDLDYFNYSLPNIAIMFSVFAIADHVDYDKILYVDVDMIVNGSLYDIWNIELGDNILASTLDCNLAISRAASGINENDPYFNTGIALINLSAMRKYNIKQKTLDFIRNYNIIDYKDNIYRVTGDRGKTWEIIYSNTNNIYLHIQGVWANLSRGRAIVLHPKYNVLMKEMTEPVEKYIDEWKGFWTEKEIIESRKNPVVIHFAGDIYCKPWNDVCNHPSKELYYKYKERTIFKGTPLIHCEKVRVLRKRDFINKMPDAIKIVIYSIGYIIKRKRGRHN